MESCSDAFKQSPVVKGAFQEHSRGSASLQLKKRESQGLPDALEGKALHGECRAVGLRRLES